MAGLLLARPATRCMVIMIFEEGGMKRVLIPEKKSPTEPLDLQHKIEDTMAGRRPIESKYPYFPPDYEVPFLHIGTERQLFLDNFILDHLEDVKRVFPRPNRPGEPILKARELPWELDRHVFPAAAIQDPDDKKFKLWYAQSLVADPYGDRGMVMCYAEATDPLHWEKPLSDRCIPYQEHSATNIVLEDSGHHIVLALNPDRSDPERKYLLTYNPGDRAKQRGRGPISTFCVSSDGLQWTEVNESTSYRHHHFQRPIWDEAIQKWIAYSQYSHHWNFLHRKRQIGRQESADFINWSPKEVVLSNDWDPNLPPHIEFHDMSVRKVGGLYIGIMTEFHAEPIWNAGGDHNWRDHAYATLSLYASRNGKRWQRVDGPGPWVDRGRPGTYDYGFLNDTVAGQLVHDGKSYIVYGARPEKQCWHGRTPPGPMVPGAMFARGDLDRAGLVETLGRYPRMDFSIGVLILREDGWAELKPVYERGRVITRQFVFEGDTLEINADAYGGYVRVEALDPHFKPYEGFSAGDCDPIYSDDPNQIWHTVHWRGSTDVRALWNKPVRLVLHLHQASLYAFQFEETARP